MYCNEDTNEIDWCDGERNPLGGMDSFSRSNMNE